MPYAVTHILIPIILVSIIRDFYLKKKQKANFHLHYVLIAGLGGVLPDIDIIFSFFLNIVGIDNWYVHRTITHSLLLPLILFALFIVFTPVNKKARICNITRHNLKLSTILLMLSIGVSIHILLDSLFGELAYFLYPILAQQFGINLVLYLPKGIQDLALPTLDGALLVLWITYLELRHKISDYI